jgi:hypothetical protein
MTDQEHADPDDLKQDWINRQAREGWTTCPACGTTLHEDDIAEGTGCICGPEDCTPSERLFVP